MAFGSAPVPLLPAQSQIVEIRRHMLNALSPSDERRMLRPRRRVRDLQYLVREIERPCRLLDRVEAALSLETCDLPVGWGCGG